MDDVTLLTVAACSAAVEAPWCAVAAMVRALVAGGRYYLAVTFGGQAIQISLRAAGVRPGDTILANAPHT